MGPSAQSGVVNGAAKPNPDPLVRDRLIWEWKESWQEAGDVAQLLHLMTPRARSTAAGKVCQWHTSWKIRISRRSAQATQGARGGEQTGHQSNPLFFQIAGIN